MPRLDGNNDGKKVVADIRHKMNMPPGGESRIKSVVIEKYGKPTETNSLNGHPMLEWCAATDERGKCPVYGGVSLLLFGNMLILTNSEYAKRAFDEMY